MVFGKNKKKKEEPVLAAPDEVVDYPGLPRIEVEPRRVTQPDVIQPVVAQPIVTPQPAVQQPVAEARIISGQLLESGLHQYVIIATKELGLIGETFPID